MLLLVDARYRSVQVAGTGSPGFAFLPGAMENRMTKPLEKTIKPVPDDNQSHKGPGSAPKVPVDTTKGHRDDEKANIREQGDHGNMVQNTSNRRSG
jgi:hypothetical protein